ncbi:MAG: twin-arginine translocation signal domain-containing protein, partial [Woeseiaceae bacterium]
MSNDLGLNRRNFLKGAGMTALASTAPISAIADDDEGKPL